MNRFSGKHLLVATVLMFLVALGAQQLFAAVNGPWIGIYMQDVNADLAEAFSLSVRKGVLVNDIADNSPAEKAGLKQKDVILTWNGKPVEDSKVLTELVGDSKVGDNVKLSINRDGKEMDVTVQVGERKEARSYSDRRSSREPMDLQFLDQFKSTGIGVSLQSLSGKLGEYFGVPDGNGALITDVMKDTPAEKAGLRVGDVIIKADNDKVESPSDVSSIIGDKKKGEKVELVVVRDKAEKTFTVEVEEIDSFGWTGTFDAPMPRFHQGERMPQIYRFDTNDHGDLERKMDDLQDKLEELQRKLDKLESRMK